MQKNSAFGITYWEVNLGPMSLFTFDPEEMVVRMAVMGMSMN